MAEFTELGDYCNACKRIDFLPFKCIHCNLIYCKEHRSVELHQCLQTVDSEATLQVKPSRKEFAKCHFCQIVIPNSHELVKCEHCSNLFGLCHRLPEIHACAPFKQSADEALVKATACKVQSKPTVSAPKVRGAKNEALARKVQLMKLRQSALGIKATPFDERLHFNLFVHRKEKEREQHRYFLSKEWTIGRSIDYLAIELKLPNYNNDPNRDLLVLSSNQEGEQYFAFDLQLKQLQEELKLFDGDSIHLRFVSRS